MQSREAIKTIILKLFVSYGQEKQAQRMTVYTDDFCQMGIKPEELNQLITVAKQNCKYLPTIAEIIEPIRQQQETTDLESMEVKVNNRLNDWEAMRPGSPYHQLEPWAYTVKKRLGISRVENATEDEWKWIRKEAKEIIGQLLRGEIEEVEDQRNWKKIGNSWALMPSTGMGSIGASLASISSLIPKQIQGQANENQA